MSSARINASRLSNLRPVHLMPSELFESIREAGFEVTAGDLGENITTAGLELERLPLGIPRRARTQKRADRPSDALRPHPPLQASPNGTCSRRRKRALDSNPGFLGGGAGRRGGRGGPAARVSAPVLLISRLGRLSPKDPCTSRLADSQNRNAVGRSNRHGRKQGNGGTLGAGEAIDSPGLPSRRAELAASFWTLITIREALALARSRASRRRSRLVRAAA